jgi:hypothetical protein
METDMFSFSSHLHLSTQVNTIVYCPRSAIGEDQ